MKKIILAFTCLAVLFSSCEDFLTKEPPMNESDATALASFSGINKATNGNYIGFASWYGELMPLTFDLMCGNGMVGPVDYGYKRGETAWNYTPTSTLGVYGAGYSAILGINKVLEAIEKDDFTRDATVTQADIDNVKAENLALRAMIYFDMVRIYSQSYAYIVDNNITGDAALGVPLVTKDDLNARPARETVATIYDFIISELKQAESLMSEDYERAGVQDKRATLSLPVIHATMARVYLEHKEYQLAAEYAKKVIDRKDKYQLLKGEDYLTMWKGDFEYAPPAPYDSEIIFELVVAKGDGISTGLGMYLSAPEKPGDLGYGDVRISNDLLKLFDTSDIRFTKMTKNNLTADPSGKYRWSTKYPGKLAMDIETQTMKYELKYNNVPIIRIPEMYLIIAEASYYGASIPGQTVQSALNSVATSRGAAAYSNPTIANIFAETRKEFLFEGHVFFDMKRLQLPLNRTDYDLEEDDRNIPVGSYKWALPIPKHEIDNNRNIVQNPGYNMQ